MKDPDEVEEVRYQIEDLVKGLIKAFPNVKYVAINASVGTYNLSTWENEWYAVGFEEAPWMKELDGYFAWVKSPDVENSGEEEAVFFTHFVSSNWYYKDQPLQKSRTEFMGEEDLCFYVADSGEVLQYKDHFIYVDEEVDKNALDDMIFR